MKKIIVVSLLLLFITSNFAMADLTTQDLREIQALLDEQEKRIKEYVDVKIETVNAKIDAVEKSVNARIDAVNTRIDAFEKRVDSRFESVERGEGYLKWMIGILALVVVAGIAFPPIWQELRERKKSSLAQRVAELEREAAELKKKMILPT